MFERRRPDLTDTSLRQVVLAAEIWPGNRKPYVCKMSCKATLVVFSDKPLGFMSFFDMFHGSAFVVVDYTA